MGHIDSKSNDCQWWGNLTVCSLSPGQDIWFVVLVVGPFELYGPGSRNLTEIFCSWWAIRAASQIAIGKHKLCMNCYELFSVCTFLSFKPSGNYQPIIFFCMFFWKHHQDNFSFSIFLYGPVELTKECFWRNSFEDHPVASEQWKFDSEIWKCDLLNR